MMDPQQLDALLSRVEHADATECHRLLSAVAVLQRALDERLAQCRFALFAEALRTVLQVQMRCSEYYGGQAGSEDNALALALTCSAFRDAVFEAFPVVEADPNIPAGKRFLTRLQVQSVGRLRWARSLGGPWNHHVCDAAAEQGMYDVLRVAHDEGCPWDDAFIMEAVVASLQGSRDFDILEWCVERGALINEEALAAADQKGRADVREWLRFAMMIN